MEKYRKAGKMVRKALDAGAKKIKPGAKLLDVAELVEDTIEKEGGECSFPCNISVNNQAAHFTPGIDDEITFGEKDVVKLDCGSLVDGWIGDAALTIDLSGENGKLVDASKEALENVISKVRAGVNSSDLGAEVENTITKYGFKPVKNLSGHLLEEYDLHAGLSIPNTAIQGGFDLEEGQVFAIEPFATMGKGQVNEERRIEIYSMGKMAPVRNADARKIIDYAKEFASLPFAERWLEPVCDGFKLKVALREIVSRGVFETYPVLSDTGLVSQAEHTVIVTKDSCEITTK